MIWSVIKFVKKSIFSGALQQHGWDTIPGANTDTYRNL